MLVWFRLVYFVWFILFVLILFGLVYFGDGDER